MADLLHITDRIAWDAAERAGSYRLSTRGVSLEQQGFIHCSLPHQLRGVAEANYEDVSDLVVLVIDEASLPAEVRYEDGGDGEKYPHIYGPLPVSSVTEVIPVTRDQAGRMILPGRIRKAPHGQRD
ncbi:MAG TPA: DUF952 domain-containing protein [Streptosporangiaceae bacterium]|jgi:uncharacterized protein (DUF952 family)|nr:DUF952 domain-containing protein [Streptosporangiaceae bacterium]